MARCKVGRKIGCIFLFLMVLCSTQRATAQYYTWGSDAASLRWDVIRTPDVRIIYPDTVADLARRTLFYIETVKPDIGYGFRHGPMRIPFVMHPENFQSNGLVMWLPKRIEFLSSPSIDGYSMPWLKQLVAHEYRHAVQYNNLNRGLVRIASWLLGQQGSTLGLLLLPLWTIEGDATMSETEMSSFGRGLQPRFTLEYRALGNIAKDGRNCDKWFCGSYREMVPDHYQLGYQLCSYAYTHYGENIWDKVVWYSVRNPYLLLPGTVALKKFYKTSEKKLFTETFDDLNTYWQSLPAVENTTESLTTLPDGNYTTYKWPLPLSDTTVLAFKSDYDRPARFVRIDTRTGDEQLICYTGNLSTRPAIGGGRVWWTEYRRSLLFEQRVNSQLCYMDLSDEKPRTYPDKRKALYPTVVRDSLPAWVEYLPDGTYTVVRTDGAGGEVRCNAPQRSEIHGLAWDEVTEALYVLVTDNSGMWPGRVDADGVHPLREGAYITLSDLRAAGGKLYFGSIASGHDEAHCLDLASGREYCLTTSTYGSFAPAPASGDTVLVTTYSRHGYSVARQTDTTQRELVVASRLPRNVVNPPRTRWNVVNLDTANFSVADSVASQTAHRTRRYRKVPTLINVHSWMPLAFNPFELVDEHNVAVNVGVTLLSQNLLSNAEGFVSYGWNRDEGSLLRAALRYFGLGVHLEIDGAYGGNQVVYSLMQTDPVTGVNQYQRIPSPNRYYAVGATASLPLYFQRGYHTRQLSLSAGWNFSNGLVAQLGEMRFDTETGTITNLETIGFRTGLHKLTFGVGFSDAVRTAHRDFITPWGYTVSANYAFNPSNSNFSDLISLYGRIYTPGFFAHNSLSVAVAYQTSLGGYKSPSGKTFLSYKSTRLLPRGMSSSDIRSDNYMAASLDYQFSLCYPEGGIPSLLYFKRIRLNLGGDFAQFRFGSGSHERWRRLWSYGGDIIFDVNVLRQPASATSSVKLSVYKPSNGGVWFALGLGLPF